MSNSRWTQPAGRTTGDFILVAVGDPALHPEATHVAAATGYAVMDSADPREISRLHTRARAVLVDADIAAHVSTLARRPGVYFLAADPGPVDWQAALNCHAEHAYVLPAQAAELLTELGHADAAPRIPDHPGSGGADHASTVIAVLGAAGGAGTSTLAAAMARVCATDSGAPVTLIDADGGSGGLDLLLGLEDTPGARWPDLRLGEGAVSAVDLRAALPGTRDGVAVLSAARSTIADPFRLGPDTISPVLDSIRGAGGTTIVDTSTADHHTALTVLDAADQAILLIPAEVRPAAAAARITADLRRTRTSVAGIARHRGWAGLSSDDLEKITQCDIIAELGTITRLARTVELSGLPDQLPRPLLTCARAALAEAGTRS